ncbi:hypothetical protein PAESOLCIP111_01654 [Paenibacillus solanacearum]|uniref:Uncharacterized protein n=1 Tax=Paenibacillus solanacearum TaxID=2048548 RepID=A0A916JYG2_9BACL|nr:hypothetical protein PAESOLCIP111_01654 [Paenibacillus solanacearum]
MTVAGPRRIRTGFPFNPRACMIRKPGHPNSSIQFPKLPHSQPCPGRTASYFCAICFMTCFDFSMFGAFAGIKA